MMLAGTSPGNARACPGLQPPMPGCNPPSNRSCQEILYCFPSSSSGYYQIHATNGSLVDVYCNMEGTNCGNITGWTRVAYLNMTQPHATCPPPLVRTITAGLTLCHRSKSGCDRVLYSTLDLSTHKCVEE